MANRSRDHIVTGGGTAFVRILQLLCALAIVGIAAYGLVFRDFSGLELNMFTAAMTVIGCIFFLATSTIFVRFYNYWAALVFDAFGFIFWITSFALLVSQIRPWYRDNYYYTGCDWYREWCYKRDVHITKRATTSFFTYRTSMGAIAALAGLLMLLFLGTLVSLAAFIAGHRSHGGHALYSRQDTSPVTHQSKGDMEMQPATAGATHEPSQGVASTKSTTN